MWRRFRQSRRVTAEPEGSRATDPCSPVGQNVFELVVVLDQDVDQPPFGRRSGLRRFENCPVRSALPDSNRRGQGSGDRPSIAAFIRLNDRTTKDGKACSPFLDWEFQENGYPLRPR